MKAIRVSAYGGPSVLKLEEIPAPQPASTQVLVRNHAVGVNPVDTYLRSNTDNRGPKLPYTPGSDSAGVVEAVGDGVTRVRKGDRVYVGGSLSGAYAEMTLCEQTQVHELPGNVSYAQGCAVNVPYATAFHALFHRAHGEAGESVLVHGASGGVGIAAVQLARARGMTVIGTAGSDEGLDLVRKQGAAFAINHKKPNYLEEVTAATGGRGPDVILEMLANVNLDNDLTIVAPGGRIVVIGNRGRIEIDPRKIMAKDCSVFGQTLWGIAPDDIRRAHEAIVAGLESGALNPVVGTEMPLRDAAKAHVRQRRQFGQAIADFQGVQWMIADREVDCEAARLLILNAAHLKDQGRAFAKEASMAKLFASEAAHRATDTAIHWRDIGRSMP